MYHDLGAEDRSQDYGSEYGIRFDHQLGEIANLTMKYASYNAETFSVDTDKLWIMVGDEFAVP